MKRSALVLTALLLAAGAAHAQIYQWKDENGKTVISDKPPTGKVQQSKTLSAESPAPTPAAAPAAQSRRSRTGVPQASAGKAGKHRETAEGHRSGRPQEGELRACPPRPAGLRIGRAHRHPQRQRRARIPRRRPAREGSRPSAPGCQGTLSVVPAVLVVPVRQGRRPRLPCPAAAHSPSASPAPFFITLPSAARCLRTSFGSAIRGR